MMMPDIAALIVQALKGCMIKLYRVEYKLAVVPCARAEGDHTTAPTTSGSSDSPPLAGFSD